MRRMWVNWLAIALLPLAVVACALPRSSATPTPSGSPGVESASPSPAVSESPTPSPAVSESPTPRGEIDSLEKARAAWASSGINNYDFTITRQCFCIEEYAGPFTVRVRDGVSTVTRSSDGSAVDPDVLKQLPVSAEELFQFAEERKDQASFRVEFDQATGLPLSVWSDPIPEAADDELGVEVSGFTAAP